MQMLTREAYECILCAYKPMLKLSLLTGLFLCNFKCDHSRQRLSVTPSGTVTIISLLFFGVHITALLLVTVQGYETKNILDFAIWLRCVAGGWLYFLIYILFFVSRCKYLEWLEYTLSISVSCSYGNTTKRFRKTVFLYVIFFIIWIPLETCVCYLSTNSAPHTVLSCTFGCMFYASLLTFVNYFKLTSEVIREMYKNVENISTNTIDRHCRIDECLMETIKFRKSIYCHVKAIKQYTSGIVLFRILYASVWTTTALSAIAEAIKVGFCRPLIFYLLNDGIGAIALVVFLFSSENLFNTDLYFISVLHKLTLKKPTTIQISRVEQLIADVEYQSLRVTTVTSSPLSRKLSVKIVEYGITYFIVYLQMYYFHK